MAISILNEWMKAVTPSKRQSCQKGQGGARLPGRAGCVPGVARVLPGRRSDGQLHTCNWGTPLLSFSGRILHNIPPSVRCKRVYSLGCLALLLLGCLPICTDDRHSLWRRNTATWPRRARQRVATDTRSFMKWSLCNWRIRRTRHVQSQTHTRCHVTLLAIVKNLRFKKF